MSRDVDVPDFPAATTRTGSGLSLAIIGSRGFPSTYGGYETLVRYLAPYIADQGHHVTVYCREPFNGQRVWYRDGVRCIASRGRESKQLSTLSFGATSIFDASLRRFDAALVLNIANGYWMPLLNAAGVPFAVNTDGLEWKRAKWSRLGRGVFRAAAELSARFAPELVCDSRALGDIWKEEFGRGSHFIPYGAELLPPLDVTPVRDLGLESGTYALVVARLVPENNVELTLNALETLGAAAPPLVIVGSANFETALTKRLEALQAAGRAQWLGHVSDQQLLATLWQHAGAYVHGHSVGGTNPALLQALGAGAPTLALDTPFNREVLAREDHLFPPEPNVLGALIAEVVHSDSRRAALIDHGRNAVADRYDWDDVCRSYTELLVELAVKKRTLVSA